jgi:hypothetical protein
MNTGDFDVVRGLTRDQAQQRAAEIKSRNAAARSGVEQAKAETPSIPADQLPDDAALAGATDALCQARATLDHLQGQRLVAEAHGADLANERQCISFAAHSGDKAARARLTALHAEIATHGSELASISAAISEAERRLGQATAAHSQALEQQKARETLARLDDLVSAAAGCDAALSAFLKSFDALERIAVAIGAVAGVPNRDIVRVLSVKALHTALFSHQRVFDTRHLPPNERISFCDMAAGWSRAVSGWANGRLAAPDIGHKDDKEAA